MAEQAQATESGLEIDISRFAEMLKRSEAQVIDVRREYEFDSGHVPGARHVEINDLTAAADSIHKDRPVVFVCRTGNRSGMAAEAFEQAGYDAHNLAGGITAWAEQGNPLEPEDGEVAEPRPL